MSDSEARVGAMLSSSRKHGDNGDVSVRRIFLAILGIVGGAVAIPLLAVEWCRFSESAETCAKEMKAAETRIQKLENAFEFQAKVLVEQKALLDDARREQTLQSKVLTRIETKLERLEPR